MYSKEDKERILALFHASGMSMKAACDRTPGFPGRDALRKWLRDEELGLLHPPTLEVRGRVDHIKHKRYPDSTKREAVRLVGQGLRHAEAARRLGVSRKAVSRWVGQHRDGTLFTRPAGPGGREERGPVMGARSGDAPDQAHWREWAADLPGDPEERLEAMERKYLEMAAVLDVLKAPAPASLSNAEKRAAGAMAAAEGVAVSDLCGDLSIPRSTYYGSREARRAAEDRRARIEWAAVRVREAFEASGGVYGSAAVAAALRRRAPGGPEPVGLLGIDPGDRDTPLILSEKVVRRLMRQQGLVAARARKGRGRYSSYAGELRERPCNQLLLEGGGHCFAAGLPFSVIVTDFTEFALPGGEKCYLSPAIDCFDGDVVAWRISRHPDAALACGMLEDAAAKAGGRSFVVHTDGGGVYMSDAWVKACERLKVERSMSRKATSPDNARAEGFFGALKAEFFHCRDWTGVTCERFAAELDAYIRWYRDCRIKESLGWRTIREYREELGVAA